MAKTIVVDNITYRFQIWDTAGQERVCMSLACIYCVVLCCVVLCCSVLCTLLCCVVYYIVLYCVLSTVLCSVYCVVCLSLIFTCCRKGSDVLVTPSCPHHHHLHSLTPCYYQTQPLSAVSLFATDVLQECCSCNCCVRYHRRSKD